MAVTAATSDAAPVSAKRQSVRAPNASSDPCTLRRDQSTTCSKPSTFAHGNVAVYSSVVHTYAKNSVTRAHVAHVGRLFSTRLAAAAAVQSCTHLCHAEPNHHLADILANAPKHAGTRKCLTTATKTMRLVPNARFLWRSGACAGKRPSRINSAGCKMSAAAMSAVTSFVVVPTSVASPAIDQVNVKIQTARLARSLVASRKRLVGIQTRTCVTHHSRVRKRSLARARSLSLATAKRRNRR